MQKFSANSANGNNQGFTIITNKSKLKEVLQLKCVQFFVVY